MKMFRLTALLLLFGYSPLLFAGAVRTKDYDKKECGGYRNGKYHIVSCKEKHTNLKEDQGWHNPFKGFTKSAHLKKTKGQGQMPTTGNSN